MKLLAFLFFSLFAVASQAQIEFGVAAGMRSNQIDTDIVNASTSSKTGYQVGPVAYFPFTKMMGLRTGFLYTQRFATIGNTNQGDVDIQYAYFDVPATLMVKLADFAAAFGGPVLAFNQAKDVSCSASANCAAADVKSLLIPWQLGLSARFLPQVGAELFYEFIPGELSTNVSNMRSVGANLLFYFE